jgi:hypothetical protein
MPASPNDIELNTVASTTTQADEERSQVGSTAGIVEGDEAVRREGEREDKGEGTCECFWGELEGVLTFSHL